MRISGTAGEGGEVSGSQKAAIERQIRRLEEKRDEILEKLGLKKPKKKDDAAGVSGGTLAVTSIGSDAQKSIASSQSNSGSTEVGTATPIANITSVGTQNVGEALNALAQKVSSSSSGMNLPEDREGLVAQLKAIEMQIMALRKQINDDSLEVPEVDIEKAADLAASGMMAREAGRTAESVATPPTVEVTTTGSVDGYA